MTFHLGLDCGGTGTRAFLVDGAGRCGGWGESGQSNPHHANASEVKAHLAEAIGGACAKAGGKLRDCGSVFVGMAGVTNEAARSDVRSLVAACGLEHARIGVDHDIRIALAGGLGGRPGMALIVGTGSSCYGRAADGRTWQSGGWGSLIADEGSGFYLGREAISAAARMADGREAETKLRAEVFTWLGIADVSELLNRIHAPGFGRAEIAAFAPGVVELAGGGDKAALAILDRGAFLLAEMVAANHRMLPTGTKPELVITGGLGTAVTIYRDKIERAVRAQLPEVQIRQPLLPPVIGAALLAMEQAGQPVTEELVLKLKDFAK
jgi:N-acetylglucosamine kinase-like BadF-type ATPase